MSTRQVVLAAFLASLVSACNNSTPAPSEPRPVRAVTIERAGKGETFSLTGQVRAKDQVNFAFRLEGRMLERLVNVGDVVRKGQVVARLDAQDEQNALRSAQANLASAVAALNQARLSFWRQQELLKNGNTPRALFDEAQKTLLTAQAQSDSAQAQLHTAQDQLGYTTLTADAAGAVTATGAEAGEVVHPGQTIVQIAYDGARDAVFDVPESFIRTAPHDPPVELALTNDPQVRATGRVREVAPQADAATRTFQVKVGIIDPPPAMRLGATVTGSITLAVRPGMPIPASALTQADGHPAVWVVDPETQTVSLRGIDVAQYDPATVLVSNGIDIGDRVVTAGVQTLRPGQKVRLLGAGS
jgi:membrane fusion protein, multidrug efflux system